MPDVSARDRQMARRRARVRRLHEQGRSIRQIADILDCGRNTVERDLRALRQMKVLGETRAGRGRPLQVGAAARRGRARQRARPEARHALRAPAGAGARAPRPRAGRALPVDRPRPACATGAAARADRARRRLASRAPARSSCTTCRVISPSRTVKALTSVTEIGTPLLLPRVERHSSATTCSLASTTSWNSIVGQSNAEEKSAIHRARPRDRGTGGPTSRRVARRALHWARRRRQSLRGRVARRRRTPGVRGRRSLVTSPRQYPARSTLRQWQALHSSAASGRSSAVRRGLKLATVLLADCPRD
jgi:DNA-binding CsgD family transcriptional regulator